MGLTAAVLSLLPAAILSAAAQNSTQLENAKPGTSEWRLSNPGYAKGVIEGYPSTTSVNRGGQIRFFVSTSDPSYTLEIFRMGYYQGLGGRRMTAPVTLPGIKQAIPTPDPATGLIECNWTNPYVLTIPASADPTDWMSGFYYVKLTGSSSVQQFIHFVVRDDARPSDVLLAEGITTAEAYNVWGGKSLYGTIANRGDTANAAKKVSFDRPFYGDDSFGAGNFSPQNDLKVYEWGMVRFLEANGYDVTYATNLDVDRDANLLLTHKAFLSVGHDEYWSWTMRDNVERARDRGVSLGFFSANTSYWQVRFEPSVSTGAPSRVMVGYKSSCAEDPITPIYLRTCRFRDSPVNRSEDRMVGVMYITQGRMPFVVEDASHWLLTDTGLHNGDALLNPDGTPFIGYEVDAVGPASPANLERVGHSPATPRRANFSDLTVYRASSGATVFASGSILWTYDVPQIVQMTRNVLARLIANSFADTAPVRPALPAPLAATDIGDVGRAGFVAAASPDAFTLNGAGQDRFAGRDALYYVHQPLAGDGALIARVTAVQGGWDNRAGLMIRESLAADARYASIVSRPSESRAANGSGVNEGVEFKIKSAVGGAPQIVAMADLPLPNWIKLTRTGATFQASYSADGVAWTVLGSASVAMPAQARAGMSIASAQHGVWVTAGFDNVGFGGGGSVSTPPTVTSPPSSVVVPTGQTVTFRSAASGTPAPAAQWQVSVSGGAGWADIPGATTPTLSFVAQRSDSGKLYRVVYTNTVGSVASAAASLTVGLRVRSDLDADRKTDLVLWRPSSGAWMWLYSSDNYQSSSGGSKQWGDSSLDDIPVSADIDGDGRTDLAVWRPRDGTWYWLLSSSGYNYSAAGGKQWGSGSLGDVPLSGDIDGDGKTDLIVWRPRDGTWYWLTSSSGYNYSAAGGKQWGNAQLGDIPLTGDMDGDGKSDLIIWRPSNGTWYWLSSSTGYDYARAGGKQWGSGSAGDVPLTADLDGDGASDLVVWRASNGTWYWLTSASGYSYAAANGRQWGNAGLGDIPMLGDLDGDGMADLIVWRDSTATWFWLVSSANYSLAAQGQKVFGATGDRPMIR